MHYHTLSKLEALDSLNVSLSNGLTSEQSRENRLKYGENTLTKAKKRGFFARVFSALKEPMLIILLFSFVLAFGVSLGKFLKTGEADFGDSFGILFAVVLSVSITLIMEGSSERAFSALNKIYENVYVKVLRDGSVTVVKQEQICVGDIVILESGDKIVADGRLIESESLTVDESALTGESFAVRKDAELLLNQSITLAERKNMVYSGTFVTSGTGKMLVTATGDRTEIGNIASSLKTEKDIPSPLQQKLASLGKTVTIIGAISAIAVFIISLVRLVLSGSFTFSGLQDLFVSCIILIVAAVPEGLPTIVVISLALNMIKLAKENALIKKMIATETAGAVSVICSDKTGTLTENKMQVLSVCSNEFCLAPEKVSVPHLIQNFFCNSTADLIVKKGKVQEKGSGTECALIKAGQKAYPKTDYLKYRAKYPVISRTPFSSQTKLMTTTINYGGVERTLIKGAPEKVLTLCDLTDGQRRKLLADMETHFRSARRVICFAHSDGDKTEYDGYAVLADGIRKDVYKAVNDCKKAGISVKILTGDNYLTAYAVAKELGIADSERQVIVASDIEKLDDTALKKILPRVTVIARSTPIIKLRVVKALKELGEVVAVTGDGINDSPAIKHADVGIAMGVTGSEITKETAEVVLLDDSFSTIVKVISFGRNVYKNLQRFILFQLSVNLSALLFVTVSSAIGLSAPFNTLQLLWINVIMDGPPALTLGLESMSDKLMEQKPVRRDVGIVNGKMLIRIAFNGLFIGGVMIAQYLFNFLGVPEIEQGGTVFTLFIIFQLFNAFNSRELGKESVLKSIGKNKIMVLTFGLTFLIQLLIVTFIPSVFGISALSLKTWLKILAVGTSIIAVSELFKLGYRAVKNHRFYKNQNKINKKPVRSVN